MKILIMGCGRVGEAVSILLAQQGHEVAVIDKDQRALDRLAPRFKGKLVCGGGFDRNMLIQAGIEEAEAFAATSSSDTINIISARVARNLFHVPRVVARLFDPRRAEIYQRLGLVTMSSTDWGAGRISELITHSELDPVMTFGNGEAKLLSIEASPTLIGRTVRDLTLIGDANVVAVTRNGQAFLPTLGTEFRRGDIIHLAVMASAMDQIETLLDLNN